MTTTLAAGTGRGARSRVARPDHHAHVNDVSLIGELSAVAEDRTHAGGAEVTTFRVTVRSPAAEGASGTAERIDCVAKTAGIRKRAGDLDLGDTVELSGMLRHRYWRTPAGLGDRYEVEVTRCRRLRRA